MWMASVFAVAIFALIGGGLSFLFNNTKTNEGKSGRTNSHHAPNRSTPPNDEDDKFYEEVARELQDKPMIPGLWTKAIAETGGDDPKARALYIRYRVQQLAANEARRQESVEQKHKREIALIKDRFSYLRDLKYDDDERTPNSHFDGNLSILSHPVNSSIVADALGVPGAAIIIAIRSGKIAGVRCDGEWFVDLGVL